MTKFFESAGRSAIEKVEYVGGLSVQFWKAVRSSWWVNPITGSVDTPLANVPEDFFDFSAPFAWRWQNKAMRTALKRVDAGGKLAVGPLRVAVPRRGDGVALMSTCGCT